METQGHDAESKQTEGWAMSSLERKIWWYCATVAVLIYGLGGYVVGKHVADRYYAAHPMVNGMSWGSELNPRPGYRFRHRRLSEAEQEALKHFITDLANQGSPEGRVILLTTPCEVVEEPELKP